jgi:trehalose synthase
VRGRRFLHVSPSRFGGGPAEILHRAIPILRDLGVEAEWEVIVGNPDFYAAVARMERGLTGLDGTMTEAALHAWAQAAARNAAALPLDADLVMVHDLAPLARAPPPAPKWVWRCNGDSRTYRRAWYRARRLSATTRRPSLPCLPPPRLSRR